MRQNVYIQKDLILKHIELADLDLEDLPQFPIIEKRSRPRLLGVVK
jgi:hypothetical protein